MYEAIAVVFALAIDADVGDVAAVVALLITILFFYFHVVLIAANDFVLVAH